MQVLDYSAGFPGASAIKAAGYAGAVRYAGFPGRKKCTTAGELADFTAHGLGMALIFEDAAARWRTGRTGGALDAGKIRDHANDMGFPAWQPYYFAVDQDVVTVGEFALMLDYLRGAGDTLGGPARVGVYGEADAIDRARDAGVATLFWQTVAWSKTRRTASHLYQRVGTVYVGGVGCDVNDVLAANWGQHGSSSITTLEDDVAFTDTITVASPGDRSYKESGEAAKFIGDTYFWTADMFKALFGQFLPALTAIAENHGADAATLTAAIGDAVNAGTKSAIESTVLPALEQAVDASVTRALGEDRAADASAISAAIMADLAAKLTAPTG